MHAAVTEEAEGFNWENELQERELGTRDFVEYVFLQLKSTSLLFSRFSFM